MMEFDVDHASTPPKHDSGIRCVSCGASAFDPLLESFVAPFGAVHLVRCRACGLVFQQEWRREFPAELYAYYARYRDKPEHELYDPLNDGRIRVLLDGWEKRVRRRRLLDVGCGIGHLVRTASRRGWDAQGIDLAEDAIAVATAHGVSCRRADFFGEEFDGQRFDVIVMSELIEHVPEPVRFLRRARDLLSEDGILYLTTPNFDCLTRRVRGGSWTPIHPEHLSYFSRRTLIDAIVHADLRVVFAETRNVDVVGLFAGARRVSQAAVSPPPQRAVPPGRRSATPRARVRAAVLRSPWLRRAQHTVNQLLDRTNLGESLVVECTPAGAPP
jgi:SAM-dependent methyltransferase